MPRRITIAKAVSRTASGVQSGRQITLALHPAGGPTGLQLRRSDVGKQWPISPQTASTGAVSTVIGDDEDQVVFVEHVLAALAAAGVSDLLIEVSGPEIPLFEGGALALAQMIRSAGTAPLDGEVEPLLLPAAIILSSLEYFIAAIPSDTIAYYYLFASDHPLIGYQWAGYVPGQDDFARDLAPARTFISYEQAEAAVEAGMLKGGSEENAIVVYPDRLSETPLLPQAFARHKLLDLMGDLYLLGRPVQAHIIGSQSGHRQNLALVRKLAELSSL